MKIGRRWDEKALGRSFHTVGSHSFASHNFKSRVSNPRTIAYAHFKMTFKSSNIPGAGPFFQIELLKTGRRFLRDRVFLFCPRCSLACLRPISIPILSLLRFVDSNFPGNPMGFHPLKSRFCLSQTLRNPES